MSDTENPVAIFISYNSADKQIASNIAIFLAAENIPTWFDEWKVSAGDSIVGEVQEGLKGCTHFLILWSKNSNKSNWVRKELESTIARAIQTKVPRIIPIRLDDTPLPALLADIKYLRYRGGTERDRYDLVESISGKKPSADFIRAIVKKYKEVVRDPDAEGPFEYKVCPECGSDNLEGSSFVSSDEEFYVLGCKECGWSTVSQ
ncbi:hypothetical protein Ngar_c12470 [Candidatus Nitrososphaera gargensis Ga9.2]|uniref:TIR domain-containing protein n=1 Tax=Nitrososphaera gargensis (strain Ga9.2) TaxID=1237085 RepID=K0IJ46_NITGG|nr:toll/interleukin-1 receptor domain-containing protein [Candidatus Nitrososphaera gargensis]AFU58187.1 hypothetical protein Ngar_c12470 [Candidatus Nitrososphaera gargensis Ga9.2]